MLKDLGIERVEYLISPDDEAFTYNTTGSWFAIAMSKAAPSTCFDRVVPPTARLCSGLR